MKAVVYKGPHKVAIEDVTDPRIEAGTDAILRITTTGICGSDLHMYDGRTSMEPGAVFGHEPMGVIEEIGNDVALIQKGDRVVVPFNVSCGFCFNCARGFTNACLTMNPDGAGAAYGFVGMGPYRGGQAELLRVPYADFNCLKLPGEPKDAFEDDFVLLSDVFPTGYHAAQLAHVMAGSTVAIFGAGPVGLLSAMSALLKGASEVYVVDTVEDRLHKAQELGAIPINATHGDPVEQIFKKRMHHHTLESMRPGEEKMAGVMCGIDAVGYQLTDLEHPEHQRPNVVLNELIRLVNPTGHIGVIGVYVSEDPGGMDELAKKGEFPVWFGKAWEKNITIATGAAPVKRYDAYLRDLIVAGRVKPSTIVSKRVSFNEVPEAYEKFDKRERGYTKVVIKPYM